MQFIPGTWRSVGVDGDGDGVRNPQDIDDAAMSTAVYLCSGKTDLSKSGDVNSAVLRYNHSQQYVDLVVSIAKAYAGGSWIAVGNGTEDDDQGVDRAGDQIGDPTIDAPADDNLPQATNQETYPTVKRRRRRRTRPASRRPTRPSGRRPPASPRTTRPPNRPQTTKPTDHDPEPNRPRLPSRRRRVSRPCRPRPA